MTRNGGAGPAIVLCCALAFCLSAGGRADGAELGLEAAARSVARYGRIDFRIRTGRSYRNPFDPTVVQVDLEVRAPGGRTVTVPAFYSQPYEYRRLDAGRGRESWMYPSGPAGWRARFAPSESGRYRCVATLRDEAGTVRSNEVGFRCRPSDERGFVRVSQRSPRFLEFEDGSSYFPIGQNVAFIGCGQPVSLEKAGEMFGKMAGHGANFARVWTGCKDWAIGIEARKSAWGRSWAWDPPFAPVPGSSSSSAKCVKVSGGQGAGVACRPSHNVALWPETRYVLSGAVLTREGAALEVELNGGVRGPAVEAGEGRWRRFRREFTTGPEQYWLRGPRFRLARGGTAFLKDLSLREAGGGPELLWEADPERQVMGNYNLLDCYVVDRVVRAAERRGIRLQLCLTTRDLYMHMLEDEDSPAYDRAVRHAKDLMRYAVARWGYSTAVASWEYFNEMNPHLPTGRFYREVGDYVESIDPYGHPRTTSAWSANPKDWRHPELDTAQLHFYLRPGEDGGYRDEVTAVLQQARLLTEESAPGRPVLLGECGLATEKWGLSEFMRRDRELVHFHNMLWASGLSGLSGTGMFWWWNQLDRQDVYPQYGPLAEFMGGVPLIEQDMAPASLSAPEEVHAVGLQGESAAALWIVNRRATWWASVLNDREPSRLTGVRLSVKGLRPGAYTVEWWDTRRGEVLAEERVRTSGGALRLWPPPFQRDVACRVRRR